MRKPASRRSSTEPSPAWVPPSWAPAIYCLAAGLAVWAVWAGGNPAVALAAAIPTVLLAFSVSRNATLYPGVYLGRPLCFLGFALALLGLNLSLGETAYSGLWRRSFGVFGRPGLFEHPEEGWSIRAPRGWRALDLGSSVATTVLFHPPAGHSVMQFSVTRRSPKPGETLDSVARDYLAAIQSSGPVSDIRLASVAYPEDLPAREVSCTTAGGPLPLRRRALFVSEGNDLFLLTLSAPPPWFTHFDNAFDALLVSLRTRRPSPPASTDS